MAKQQGAKKKMPATKKKAAAKKKKAGAKQKTCGRCGGTGHNARTCGSKKTATKKTTKKKTAAKKKALSKTKKMVDEVVDAVTDFAETTMAKAEEIYDEGAAPLIVEDDDAKPKPGVVPPGPKLRTPQRKRKPTKGENAFWEKSIKKLAPDSVEKASNLVMRIPRISTGNFGLDVALHGGWPQGRICRPWGLPKAAKSGSCHNTIASYQRNHCSECFQRDCDCKHRDVPEVLYIDTENKLNDMMYWPEGHGVNLDCMRIMCPPSGQNVVDFVDHVIRETKLARTGLIIVDSIAHIVSQDELKKATLDGVTVGRNAHLMNSAWRKWTSAVMSLGIQNHMKPTILCINQIRHKVGQNYGSPETMPGGIGQEFATSADVRFSAGPPTYVVWDEKKEIWAAKQKAYKSTFKPKPDQSPDFITINYRVTASGTCPPGRYGEFNYWLRSAHGHRIGDPDNGLQLWQSAKRHDLIEVEGMTKRLFGLEDRTFDGLQAQFRADSKAQKKAWKVLMKKLCPEAA